MLAHQALKREDCMENEPQEIDMVQAAAGVARIDEQVMEERKGSPRVQ